MGDLNRIDTAGLLNRSRDGDSIAIEELIRSHEARIYRLALAILNDPAEADEATQDTFVTAINRLATFRGESTFTTWLYAIALNVCRGRLAHMLRVLLQSKQETQSHPEHTVIQHEAEGAVRQAIAALNDKQREAIVLRYYFELHLNDIAQILGVNERTVRNRLQAAHERLRAALKDQIE